MDAIIDAGKIVKTIKNIRQECKTSETPPAVKEKELMKTPGQLKPSSDDGKDQIDALSASRIQAQTQDSAQSVSDIKLLKGIIRTDKDLTIAASVQNKNGKEMKNSAKKALENLMYAASNTNKSSTTVKVLPYQDNPMQDGSTPFVRVQKNDCDDLRNKFDVIKGVLDSIDEPNAVQSHEKSDQLTKQESQFLPKTEIVEKIIIKPRKKKLKQKKRQLNEKASKGSMDNLTYYGFSDPKFQSSKSLANKLGKSHPRKVSLASQEAQRKVKGKNFDESTNKKPGTRDAKNRRSLIMSSHGDPYEALFMPNESKMENLLKSAKIGTLSASSAITMSQEEVQLDALRSVSLQSEFRVEPRVRDEAYQATHTISASKIDSSNRNSVKIKSRSSIYSNQLSSSGAKQKLKGGNQDKMWSPTTNSFVQPSNRSSVPALPIIQKKNSFFASPKETQNKVTLKQTLSCAPSMTKSAVQHQKDYVSMQKLARAQMEQLSQMSGSLSSRNNTIGLSPSQSVAALKESLFLPVTVLPPEKHSVETTFLNRGNNHNAVTCSQFEKFSPYTADEKTSTVQVRTPRDDEQSAITQSINMKSQKDLHSLIVGGLKESRYQLPSKTLQTTQKVPNINKINQKGILDSKESLKAREIMFSPGHGSKRKTGSGANHTKNQKSIKNSTTQKALLSGQNINQKGNENVVGRKSNVVKVRKNASMRQIVPNETTTANSIPKSQVMTADGKERKNKKRSHQHVFIPHQEGQNELQDNLINLELCKVSQNTLDPFQGTIHKRDGLSTGETVNTLVKAEQTSKGDANATSENAKSIHSASGSKPSKRISKIKIQSPTFAQQPRASDNIGQLELGQAETSRSRKQKETQCNKKNADNEDGVLQFNHPRRILSPVNQHSQNALATAMSGQRTITLPSTGPQNNNQAASHAMLSPVLSQLNKKKIGNVGRNINENSDANLGVKGLTHDAARSNDANQRKSFTASIDKHGPSRKSRENKSSKNAEMQRRGHGATSPIIKESDDKILLDDLPIDSVSKASTKHKRGGELFAKLSSVHDSNGAQAAAARLQPGHETKKSTENALVGLKNNQTKSAFQIHRKIVKGVKKQNNASNSAQPPFKEGSKGLNKGSNADNQEKNDRGASSSIFGLPQNNQDQSPDNNDEIIVEPASKTSKQELRLNLQKSSSLDNLKDKSRVSKTPPSSGLRETIQTKLVKEKIGHSSHRRQLSTVLHKDKDKDKGKMTGHGGKSHQKPGGGSVVHSVRKESARAADCSMRSTGPRNDSDERNFNTTMDNNEVSKGNRRKLFQKELPKPVKYPDRLERIKQIYTGPNTLLNPNLALTTQQFTVSSWNQTGVIASPSKNKQKTVLKNILYGGNDLAIKGNLIHERGFQSNAVKLNRHASAKNRHPAEQIQRLRSPNGQRERSKLKGLGALLGTLSEKNLERNTSNLNQTSRSESKLMEQPLNKKQLKELILSNIEQRGLQTTIFQDPTVDLRSQVHNLQILNLGETALERINRIYAPKQIIASNATLTPTMQYMSPAKIRSAKRHGSRRLRKNKNSQSLISSQEVSHDEIEGDGPQEAVQSPSKGKSDNYRGTSSCNQDTLSQKLINLRSQKVLARQVGSGRQVNIPGQTVKKMFIRKQATDSRIRKLLVNHSKKGRRARPMTGGSPSCQTSSLPNLPHNFVTVTGGENSRLGQHQVESNHVQSMMSPGAVGAGSQSQAHMTFFNTNFFIQGGNSGNSMPGAGRNTTGNATINESPQISIKTPLVQRSVQAPSEHLQTKPGTVGSKTHVTGTNATGTKSPTPVEEPVQNSPPKSDSFDGDVDDESPRNYIKVYEVECFYEESGANGTQQPTTAVPNNVNPLSNDVNQADKSSEPAASLLGQKTKATKGIIRLKSQSNQNDGSLVNGQMGRSVSVSNAAGLVKTKESSATRKAGGFYRKRKAGKKTGGGKIAAMPSSQLVQMIPGSQSMGQLHQEPAKQVATETIGIAQAPYQFKNRGALP